MKLNNADFKRFKELSALAKKGKLSDAEQSELSALAAKKAEGGNNPVWWSKYPLIKDAANFPFNFIKGTSYKYVYPQTGQATSDDIRFVNGVRIPYFRSSGKCSTAEDALNYQMRQLWLQMHRKYRGLGAYEWADLGVGMKAIVELFADVARAERVYGVVSYFNSQNRSVPTQLLDALDFDVSDVSGDRLADFRYQINRIVTKVRSLCLPKGLGILQSYIELDSNIYADSESKRSIWYVYDCPYRAIYDAATLSTGGCIVYSARTMTGASNTRQTFNDIIADLETQANILLTDTDIARICSDVIACFGNEGNNVVTLTEMPENYVLQPIVDDTRTLQLHNSSLCGTLSGYLPNSVYSVVNSAYNTPRYDAMCMYQENGVIKQTIVATGSLFTDVGDADTSGYKTGRCLVTLTGGAIGIEGNPLIDIWKDSVTDEDKIEMTRQTVAKTRKTWTSGSNSYANFALTYGNIILETLVFYNSYNEFSFERVASPYGDAIEHTYFKYACWLSQIDWHPRVMIYSSSAASYQMVFDIDNCVSLSIETLSRLHDAAMLSGWKFDVLDSVEKSR